MHLALRAFLNRMKIQAYLVGREVVKSQLAFKCTAVIHKKQLKLEPNCLRQSVHLVQGLCGLPLRGFHLRGD